MKDTSQRIEWVDAIKGLGILFVLINHSCGFGKYRNIITACYMPLFFVAAGFTLNSEKIYSNNKFILERSKRLLIPWAVYGFFFVLLNLFSSLLRENLEWNQIAINFSGMLYSRYCLFPLGTENNIYFLMCFNNYTWFFTALFLAYIWIYCYIKVKHGMKIFMVLFYSAITLLLSFCPILLPWSIDTSFMITLFMLTGHYLKKNGYMNLSNKSNIVILVGSFFAYILGASYNGSVNFSVRIYGDRGIMSVVLFFLVGVLGTIFYSTAFKLLQRTGITKVVAYIGKNSITILCIHLLAFHLIHGYMDDGLNIYVSGMIMITITVMLSIALNIIFRYLSKYIRIFQYL